MRDEELALKISDANAGYVHNEDYWQEGQNRNALTSPPARIVVRDPEVEPCVDRTYEGTTYTSRMSGSVWPRRELPSSLKKHCLA